MGRLPNAHRVVGMCCVLAAAVSLSLVDPAPAQDNPYAPDVPEPGSVESISEYTTAPEYLPASVSYVPDSDTVPSPAEVLGHIVGTPNELHRTDVVHGYFRRLAQASARIQVQSIGMSEEGREILLAVISSEANLRDQDRLTQLTNRLADPRRTSREEMKSLVREGKALYYITGGLHSVETGSPEMLMELAYRLVVSERPEIRAIREQVIVLITPVAEPDGRDKVVDWYYRHLRDRILPYEELREFYAPPYWGHYVYHDNNRDGMQLTLALTRAVNSTYYRFRPQVLHDLHESVPFLHVSTGHGPYGKAIDPITVNEWTQLAHHEVSELQSQGLPGVWVWGFWDGWSPAYLFSVANNHNSIGRFYETFGNSMAGTFERDLSEIKYVGKPVTGVQWYRPWPPGKKVTWSLRNNTNYMQGGLLRALHYTALHGEELLRNFWIKGERAVRKGTLEPPYAWIFPEEQHDRRRLASMLDLLRQHEIELHRLTGDFTLGERIHAAGSYVVRLDQPTRNTIVSFLEEQKFPAEEANQPYDDVAWTWPLLYGVKGEPINDNGILAADMTLIQRPVPFAGRMTGSGEIYLLRDTGQNGLLPARVRLGRASVEAADAAFEANGVHYPAGSWIVRGDANRVREAAEQYGLDFSATRALPDVARHAVDLPRLGVLHTWWSTQDCGWVRYLLDAEAVPYTLLSPDDVKRGRLNGRFDVILFPNTAGDLKRILHGHDPRFGPLAYTKTPKFPSHGVPSSSEDITGGFGFVGLRNLDSFVRGGGVLVALGNAGTLPVEGGIVRRVDKTTVDGTPGSEVRARFLRTDHPIAYGYDEFPSIFRRNLPVFDVRKHDRGLVVMQFGTKDVSSDDEGAADDAVSAVGEKGKMEEKLVLSGFVKDPTMLDGKPAIIDVPTGKGRVVLFSFNPLHRHLNHSDFRLVYNVVLNWNDLPSAERMTEATRAGSQNSSGR